MGSINSTAVRGYRRSNGWTVSELAKRLGVSPGHMSRIETGDREPGIHLIFKLAETLGVDVREITHPIELAKAS